MSDLVQRLRDTPNWQRESFEHWKTATSVYDRAPFEAADEIERLTAELASARQDAEKLLGLLIRYRKETPLGHQPHMIAHEVDAAIGEKA